MRFASGPCLIGPNVAELVPFEQFFRLAGVFGVTLMIFESGLHVDFDMRKKVGLRATGVALLGTFLPMLSGMALMYAFNSTSFPLWPVGIATGVSLAPTSVGMALKMLGEAKQLGEEYGQLIVTAAFVDDILSLVALTMLLQIGSAKSSGNDLSLWSIFEPLVFSILFCGGGMLLAYPLQLNPSDSATKRYLLSWIGIFLRAVPHLVLFVSSLRGTEQELSMMKDQQDTILREYGGKLMHTAEDLLEFVRQDFAQASKGVSHKLEGNGPNGPSSKLTPPLEKVLSKMEMARRDIRRDNARGIEVFHDLAKKEGHPERITEADLAQGVVHGKAWVFQSFVKMVGNLVEDLHHPTHVALDCMAPAHEIIHEMNDESAELWVQNVDLEVDKQMKLWRGIVYALNPELTSGKSLAEYKQHHFARTHVVVELGCHKVKDAIFALRESTRRKDDLTSELALLDELAASRGEAMLKKLKTGFERINREIDVVKFLNTLRADL